MTPDPSFNTVDLHAYVDRLRNGDPGAADDLLSHVCERLERLARKMLKGFPNVGRWVDTGDVLQDALMRLLNTLKATRPESTRHFLNLAALHIRRVLLDLARHYRNRLDQPHGAAGEGGSQATAEPADPNGATAADLDQWTAFHEAVERLPVEECEVIGLVFYHGWKQAQIAELFQVDERTVRRWLRSAAVKLSQALDGHLPEL